MSLHLTGSLPGAFYKKSNNRSFVAKVLTVKPQRSHHLRYVMPQKNFNKNALSTILINLNNSVVFYNMAPSC